MAEQIRFVAAKQDPQLFLLIKFGKEVYLKNIYDGIISINKVSYYHEFEISSGIHGQGDIHDSHLLMGHGKFVFAPEDGQPPIELDASNSFFRFVDKSYIYCLYAVTPDNIIKTTVEKGIEYAYLGFTPKQQECIKRHFPDADAALLITNPESFITAVSDTFMRCKNIKTYCGFVQYMRTKDEKGFLQDTALPYIDEVMEDGKKAAFLKDTDFSCEQEFRLLFECTGEGRQDVIISFKDEKIKIVKLDDLFNKIEMKVLWHNDA